MKDNNLLMIVLAFLVGYMASGMMKNMCGGLLFEGAEVTGVVVDDTDIVTKSQSTEVFGCAIPEFIDNSGVTKESQINIDIENLDKVYKYLACKKK